MAEVSKLDIIRTKKSTAEGKVIPADALVLVDPEFPANKVLGTDANGNIVATDGGASFASLTGEPTDNTKLSTALSGKQATITGGASTIATVNLTVNRALISNSAGKVAVSDVTNTELGYLDGVTSNVQTQLDGKQPNLPSGTTGHYLQKTASGVQWSAVDALPSQSGQSGKFLTTNGTSASWADALTNTATGNNIAIGNYSTATGQNTVAIGYDSHSNANFATSVGYESNSVAYSCSFGNLAKSTSQASVAVGYNSNASGEFSTSIGYYSTASANSAIQIGRGTNSEANTMCVGLSSTNYKLLGSDGKIPAERLNVPNIQVVSALPASPVEGVIYIVTGS